MALRASIGVSRSSGPITLPLREVQLAVAHITCIRFGSATGASVWLVAIIPAFSTERMGEICCASPVR